MELTLDTAEVSLPATVTWPEGVVRGGVVALHGSSDPDRDHPLYRHLARTLAPLGFAVLRYEPASLGGR